MSCILSVYHIKTGAIDSIQLLISFTLQHDMSFETSILDLHGLVDTSVIDPTSLGLG